MQNSNILHTFATANHKGGELTNKYGHSLAARVIQRITLNSSSKTQLRLQQYYLKCCKGKTPVFCIYGKYANLYKHFDVLKNSKFVAVAKIVNVYSKLGSK